MVCLIEFVLSELYIVLSVRSVARAFDISHSAVTLPTSYALNNRQRPDLTTNSWTTVTANA
jgi:hypothetical protein